MRWLQIYFTMLVSVLKFEYTLYSYAYAPTALLILVQIVPIAYRLVKSESAESYASFFNTVLAIQLEEDDPNDNRAGQTLFDVMNSTQTVLYSDRAKGLLKSVFEKIPLAKHLPW